MGWVKCKLGDVLTFQRGFDITKSEQDIGNYPVVSSSGIQSFHNQFKVKGPGVIVGRKGTLGTSFYIKQDFWPHDTTLWVKDFKGNNPKFIFYLIKILGFERFDVGSANPSLNRNHIHGLRIKFPDIGTQRRIASILSAYDDLIENNLRRIKLLEELAQRTYEEWFVKFTIHGQKLPLNEETGLPVGWVRKKLVDIAKLTMGQSPKSEFYNFEKEGLPFHQGVKDYGYRFPENNTWSSAGNRFAFENGILFSVRAPVGRLNISPEKIILGRGLAAINHKFGYTSFLFYQLQKIFFKDNLMGGGAIFNSVTKKDVEMIDVVEPENKVLKKFNSLAFDIDEKIKKLTIQNRLLKESRDILLPRLMNGAINVAEAEEEMAMAAEAEVNYEKK